MPNTTTKQHHVWRSNKVSKHYRNSATPQIGYKQNFPNSKTHPYLLQHSCNRRRNPCDSIPSILKIDHLPNLVNFPSSPPPETNNIRTQISYIYTIQLGPGSDDVQSVSHRSEDSSKKWRWNILETSHKRKLGTWQTLSPWISRSTVRESSLSIACLGAMNSASAEALISPVGMKYG